MSPDIFHGDATVFAVDVDFYREWNPGLDAGAVEIRAMSLRLKPVRCHRRNSLFTFWSCGAGVRRVPPPELVVGTTSATTDGYSCGSSRAHSAAMMRGDAVD